MEQHKARRNQLQNEEMFEPIEIDFGYEDAVAFDSDKGKLLLGEPALKLVVTHCAIMIQSRQVKGA